MKKLLLILLLIASPVFADGLTVPPPPNELLLSSVPGTTTSLSNFTYANSGATVTLTSGSWEVSANAIFTVPATTGVTQWVCSISSTSATANTNVGFMTQLNTARVVPNNTDNNCLVGPIRFTVTTPTQIYLVVRSTFDTSTQTAGGLLRAMRVR